MEQDQAITGIYRNQRPSRRSTSLSHSKFSRKQTSTPTYATDRHVSPSTSHIRIVWVHFGSWVLLTQANHPHQRNQREDWLVEPRFESEVWHLRFPPLTCHVASSLLWLVKTSQDWRNTLGGDWWTYSLRQKKIKNSTRRSSPTLMFPENIPVTKNLL